MQRRAAQRMKTAALIFLIALGLWLLYGPLPTLWLKYIRRNGLPESAGKTLLLTFDDGPDPIYTPLLLETLNKHEARALFFPLGKQISAHPQIAERIRVEGHQMGWHAPEHRNMWLMGYFATRQALLQGREFIDRQGGLPLYRPPYGNVNIFTLILARKYGLDLLLWTVMVQDWRITPPELLLKRLTERMRPGAVICLHDHGEGAAEPGAPEQTVAALDLFIPLLREQGYSLMELERISALLRA